MLPRIGGATGENNSLSRDSEPEGAVCVRARCDEISAIKCSRASQRDRLKLDTWTRIQRKV